MNNKKNTVSFLNYIFLSSDMNSIHEVWTKYVHHPYQNIIISIPSFHLHF